ncbi:hypothetical protein OG417_47135 [Actinoallomurus sp. NBC_01490]|uniref:hypothetical protein n=1 Tax=Actinoallomurus sp. NBC_01490 TaxID=2903557 RepID=UPI002E356550|nr:hypothetical protein [Actinoallomurus sp. NBC_01490]
MGDPGMPIMAGLLAVPVGVLLFVIVLALMGRRWISPAALADAPFEDDFDEPVPYAEPWGYYEPPPAPASMSSAQSHGPAQQRPAPRHALPPAPRPQHALPPVARPQHALPSAPRSQSALPPAAQPRNALPPAARSQHALPPARPPQPRSQPYGGQPALPPVESPPALPPARPAYLPPPPESYARPERRDPYGRPYEHDPYGRPGQPEHEDSSPGAFPYGPYRQQ